MPLTRADLPAETWKHVYQVGYDFPWIGPLWGTLSQIRFLSRLYDGGFVTQGSHPDDVLATLHAGAVLRFGRRLFRAKRA